MKLQLRPDEIPDDLKQYFRPARKACGACFVCHIVEVFREVRRVLRKDGTLWLNIGDSYATNTQAGDKVFGNPEFNANRPSRLATKTAEKRVPEGLKPKDLCGMPWECALALRRDGWWLRCDLIYSKANPMPESVTDRPTRSHEYVFLLTKSPRYYWDAEAVREPLTPETLRTSQYELRPPKVDASRNDGDTLARFAPSSGRNMRSVIHIPTEPYAQAHFATFGTRLVEPCIKAGTSEAGCCPARVKKLRLRADLTEEQKARVYARLGSKALL